MRVVFDGTRASIQVPDDAEFLAALRAAALDWPFRETTATGEPAAVIRVAGERYEIVTPEGDVIGASAVGAACSAIVDVLKAYVEENPGRLCLHCGSVVLGGRLVVFPSRYRAGKSTLVARLAAAGCTVFGDDVLPLSDDDESGVALGIAPRLRVPLPPRATEEFRDFVAAHTGAADERYLYLKLVAGRLARRGAIAPLGAVVLLDRRAEGPARLLRASRGAALQALIMQNFSRTATADHLLDRLHRVMDRLPRFTLRYGDLEEAAALLQRTFARWPPRSDALEAGDPAPAAAEESEDPAPAPVRPDVPLRRNPAVKLRAVEGELFLADAEGFGIHHLNPVGAGVWNLLAEPVSAAAAVEILSGAFPGTDRGRIERDVAALFAALAAEGFVIEADLAADCIGPAGGP